MLHVPWAIGVSFGYENRLSLENEIAHITTLSQLHSALIGGWLARPHDHFPEMFISRIWIKYPYFLPCAVWAAVAFIGAAVTALFLKEVCKFLAKLFKRGLIFMLHRQTVRGGYFNRVTRSRRGDDTEPLLGSSHSEISTSNFQEEPVPLRQLLNLRVLIPVACYVCLASLHAGSNAIQPLFLAMPVNIGGLSLPSRDVGYILGTYGIANSICQLVMLGRLVRRFGVKAVFVTSISAFIPIYALSPIMNILVRRNGFSYVVWAVLVCQLSASLVMELGYGASSALCQESAKFGTGCVYMYITAASPNKRSLGATNGLAQTLVSIGRIVTPVLASSLLSFSIQYHIAWGYAAYIMLVFFAIGGICLASQLPNRLNSVESSYK